MYLNVESNYNFEFNRCFYETFKYLFINNFLGNS